MEFHIRSDRDQTGFIGNGLEVDREEKDNLEILIANMVCGCALVISSVIQEKTDDLVIRKKLADISMSMLQDVVKEQVEQDIEQSLYEKMVAMYQEWFENNCEYEDEEELIADIKTYAVMPRLLYDDEAEAIDVYLIPEKEGANFREFLGTLPIWMYEEKQSTAEATILAYELIATVLFDKVYGDSEDDNPLRAANWIHLDKQLPSFLESI